jgi:multicomponent Na+:H+ antiporter subunit G
MNLLDLATIALILAGCVFFLAGTVGMLRFPDVFTRLHAVTKADNLGLGLIVAGLLFQSSSVPDGLKLVFVWLLALLASTSFSYLVSRSTVRRRQPGVGIGEEL